MRGNEYQKEALKTLNNHKDTEFTYNDLVMLNSALGLAGECGEVVDNIKKHIFHGHEIGHRKILLELGDVLWYVAILASTIGHTLDEVMQMNIDKLNKRYPEGFSKEASINREENNGFYKLVETVGL